MRRSVGRRLKALRLAAGKTAADVAAASLASTAKLTRIENGTSTVKLADVWALCQLYRAPQATTDALSELVRNMSSDGWLEEFGDVMPSWFSTFVELESAATEVLVWDPELVYGVLQTPAYQRAVFAAAELDAATVDRQVRLRSERQRAAFDRTPPLRVTFVLGQGVLDREVGGHEVAEEQREHLRGVARLPHVDLLVLPWSAGAHPAMKGPFVILGFDAPEDPDVLYLEYATAARYIEQEGTVSEYRRRFAKIRSQSVKIEEFVR